MNMTPKVKAVGICAAIALFVYASGLLVILTPLPLLYVSAVHGRREGLWAAIAAAVAVLIVYSFGLPAAGTVTDGKFVPMPGVGLSDFFSREYLMLLGVGYFIFFATIALTLGEGIHRKWKLLHWGGMALFAGLGVIFCVVVLSALVSSGSLVGGLEGYVKNVLSGIVAVSKEAGGTSAHIDLLADREAQIASFTVRIMPSLIFVFTLLTVVVNFLLGRRIIKKRHSFAHVHNITRFRLPDNLVWAVIASGIVFFLNHYFLDVSWLGILAINGLIAMLALYFFQGLAVIAYILQSFRMPIMRMLVYVLIILFFQTISLAIVTLGVADVWINFRLRRWHARHHHT